MTRVDAHPALPTQATHKRSLMMEIFRANPAILVEFPAGRSPVLLGKVGTWRSISLSSRLEKRAGCQRKGWAGLRRGTCQQPSRGAPEWRMRRISPKMAHRRNLMNIAGRVTTCPSREIQQCSYPDKLLDQLGWFDPPGPSSLARLQQQGVLHNHTRVPPTELSQICTREAAINEAGHRPARPAQA